jgi:hypothetical protein
MNLHPNQTMNRLSSSLATAAMFLLPVHLHLAAQNDPWNIAGDFPSSFGYDIAVDASGTGIYAVGGDSSGGYGITRRSADGWGIVDSVPNADFISVAFGPAGVFVGGETHDGFWLVRQSSDGSAGSWATDDGPWQHIAGEAAHCWGVAAGPSGTVAVGTADIRSGASSWMTKLRNGAENWSVVDVVEAYGSNYARAVGVNAANGYVFVVGGVTPTKGTLLWAVRRSTLGGQSGTWSSVDSYQQVSGYEAQARAIAFDAAGNIYVAGYATTPAPKNKRPAGPPTGPIWNWVVRRGTPDGSAWCTVDSFVYGSGTSSLPFGVTVAASGSVYVCGEVFTTATAGPYWYVRRGTPGSDACAMNWQGSDLWLGGLQAWGITSDLLGNVFAAGVTSTDWVIQKLTSAP